VRRGIYNTITEFRGYELRPLLEDLQASEQLAGAVLLALKAKGVLKLDIEPTRW
jgi:hypothetical protein